MRRPSEQAARRSIHVENTATFDQTKSECTKADNCWRQLFTSLINTKQLADFTQQSYHITDSNRLQKDNSESAVR